MSCADRDPADNVGQTGWSGPGLHAEPFDTPVDENGQAFV